MDLLTMTVTKYSTYFLALNSEKLKKIWSCYSGIGLNRMSQQAAAMDGAQVWKWSRQCRGEDGGFVWTTSIRRTPNTDKPRFLIWTLVHSNE